MACMEHFCSSCDWATMNNSRWFGPCPKCGERVCSSFDEVEHDPDPRDWDDDSDLIEVEDAEDD